MAWHWKPAIQDHVHPDDQTQPTFEMTPGFKTFTVIGNNLRIYPTKLGRLKDCYKLMCGKLNIFNRKRATEHKNEKSAIKLWTHNYFPIVNLRPPLIIYLLHILNVSSKTSFQWKRFTTSLTNSFFDQYEFPKKCVRVRKCGCYSDVVRLTLTVSRDNDN